LESVLYQLQFKPARHCMFTLRENMLFCEQWTRRFELESVLAPGCLLRRAMAYPAYRKLRFPPSLVHRREKFLFLGFLGVFCVEWRLLYNHKEGKRLLFLDFSGSVELE
jgi:hypothetical protein